tara:strand:+ start:2779 stop:2934 length:156 start_codon:yes stop_codon:yes gene_type:complete
MSDWFNVLKDLDGYAKRRIQDLKRELEGTKDEKLKNVLISQLKYWEGVFKS